MAKTMTIQIKPPDEVLEDFRDAFKRVATGRRLRRRCGPGEECKLQIPPPPAFRPLASGLWTVDCGLWTVD
jgi:hypothetical protein